MRKCDKSKNGTFSYCVLVISVLQANSINGKELSSNFSKDHFARPLKLSLIYLFKMVHFIFA